MHTPSSFSYIQIYTSKKVYLLFVQSFCLARFSNNDLTTTWTRLFCSMYVCISNVLTDLVHVFYWFWWLKFKTCKSFKFLYLSFAIFNNLFIQPSQNKIRCVAIFALDWIKEVWKFRLIYGYIPLLYLLKILDAMRITRSWSQENYNLYAVSDSFCLL